MIKDETLDICTCGDFRRDHEDGNGPCRLRGGPHAGIRCEAFQFSYVSSQEEITEQHELIEWLGTQVAATSAWDAPLHDAAVESSLPPSYNSEAEIMRVLGLCEKALRVLPQDALGQDPEGWLYRDELLGHVERVLASPAPIGYDQRTLEASLSAVSAITVKPTDPDDWQWITGFTVAKQEALDAIRARALATTPTQPASESHDILGLFRNLPAPPYSIRRAVGAANANSPSAVDTIMSSHGETFAWVIRRYLREDAEGE